MIATAVLKKPVRLTKIVVTLGPAIETESMLRKVMLAGASVFRANFSHGVAVDHAQRIHLSLIHI